MPLTAPASNASAASAEGLSSQALLSAFPRKRVLVVGDIVADEYIYGETDRVSREAPVLIVRYESSEIMLGGAGNAAANLRALGAEVCLLGIVGCDEMGRGVRARAAEMGIDLVSPESNLLLTETKTRILAGGRNTRRQQMLRIDRGQRALPADIEQALCALLRREAPRCDAILVSDYGAGVLGAPLIAEVLALARTGAIVCVDSRYNLPAFVGATVLKPNEAEFEALAQAHAPDEATLRDLVRHTLRRLTSTKALLVTRGSSGMMLCASSGAGDEGELVTIPPHGTHETVDVTGAGDTVAATLALALAAGASFPQAARLANVAGALKVRKLGTVTVSLAELERELSESCS
ncbi:MAG: PfkB family carbohydrate kinase [Myxococcales bacterium]|jgi:rfaE bifunctional protein kinase chain/domain|nr:PfkB family carbohydrate kinase [Myxococcales bacterium]